MITFFTTPKPFLGHIGIIQRNAIESWKRRIPMPKSFSLATKKAPPKPRAIFV